MSVRRDARWMPRASERASCNWTFGAHPSELGWVGGCVRAGADDAGDLFSFSFAVEEMKSAKVWPLM
jgi:hypothetical protein